jgi:hypothetical protein
MDEKMDEQTQNAQSDCFCNGAGPRFTHTVRDFSPAQAADHFRNAAVEVLKGVRHIVDNGIDYLSRNPNTRGTTVNVE